MRFFVVITVLMAAAIGAAGEISIYKDRKGPVTITNVPVPDRRDQKAAAIIEYEELTDQERRQIEKEKKEQAKAWRERQAGEEREWKARMEAERKAEEKKTGEAEILRLRKEVAEARAAADAAAARAAEALQDAAAAGAYRRVPKTGYKKRPQHKRIRTKSRKGSVPDGLKKRPPKQTAPRD
ncbi:MAG: hypothetical protein HPY65_13585 [Syntrophaceae bacterium]|nr:hypothetical protein [Syntrophaceae bacterium]